LSCGEETIAAQAFLGIPPVESYVFENLNDYISCEAHERLTGCLTLWRGKQMKVVIDDGGREAAGFKGSAGDCVCRAIAIASGVPYKEVYGVLADGNKTQRITRRQRKKTGRGVAERLAVLKQWFAAAERAYAMSERIVAGRDQAAYERAMRPRPQERPYRIK
jgi:hypothetical protein